MENTANAFVESQKKKQRKKRRNSIIILSVVAVVVVLIVVLAVRTMEAQAAATSVLSYNAESVREGEVATTISGSGTLSATESDTITSAAAVTVESIGFLPGDAVKAGEVIMTLSSDELKQQLDTLRDELDSLQSAIAGTTRELSNLNVTATKKGIVKDVRASAGDAAEDLSYLCLISTDGRMKLVIDAPEGLKKYDKLYVSVEGGEPIEGSVTELSKGKATIVFADDNYAVGAAAEARDAGGTPLGSGQITVNDHVVIRAGAGRITSVEAAEENKAVSKGTVLFKLEAGAPTQSYASRKQQESTLLEQIEDLEAQLTITAAYDCILSSLPVSEGDTLGAGSTLCTLSGTGGYSMTLSIDELDISSVALGQDASITLDALEGEFPAKVTNISYAGSGSYVTSYTVTVTTEPIEGALPGMSASVEIVTETSGTSLIVSAGALQYEGDQVFVYRCADGVTPGTVLGEADIQLDSLEKVYVEAGMSNGNYVAIRSSELAVGDLIWVPTRTTLASYNPNSSMNFGFGGGMRVDTVEEYTIDANPGGMGQRPEGGGNMGGFPGGN